MSTDATTASDAALVKERNARRFRETFKYWKANATTPGMEESNIKRPQPVKCPYDLSLTTHEHTVLNTSFAIDQKVVLVIVGSDENKHRFYVHEPLLKMHSPVFNSCLSRNWSEGLKHEIDLPEDDPKIFTLFLRFLYTGQIPIIPHDTLFWSKDSAGGFHRPDIAGDIIIHSYIFADKYLANPFKNACIQALIDRYESGPDYALAIRQNAELLYAKLSRSSPLRRLYVDLWAWASTEEWHDDQGNDYHDVHTAPPEFWQDISKTHVQIRGRLVKFTCNQDVATHYPWVKDKTQYFEGERAPESYFPQPFAVDFSAHSLQPEPSDD